MAIASGSRHRLAAIAEVTYGTTPTTPAFSTLRHNSCNIGLSKDAVESEEIRGDRQITCFRHGNKSVGGDVEGELVYGEYDTLIEAALCGTWNTDVLKAGTTRRSFTVERTFQDITQYVRYTGCEVNTMSISIAPNSMVGVSFGFIGKDQSIAQTAIALSTYSTLTDTCQFDSFTATINEGGSPIALVTEMEVTLENGIEPQFVVGSSTTLRPSIGRCNVTGSITVYLEDQAMLTKFQNETESSLDVTLTDPDGNTFQIEIPKLKYNSGQPDVSGEGSVTVSMDFQAIYDSVDASNIVITRNPI